MIASASIVVAGAAAARADQPERTLSVDFSRDAGHATGVGEGILYGMSADGSQPADQYLTPLHLNAFRGGGWFSGGWIKDGYTFGSATKADIASIVAQARRLKKVGARGFQYQVLLSDLYGANGGEPGDTRWPCANGDCSNYVTFLDSTITALKKSGIDFAFDIWNEPEFDFFWGPGVNTVQYFQMWDTAVREIRRIAPHSTIVGPSFAYTPQRRPKEWTTWFAHVKKAGTVPDMLSNHDEGDVDDPVAVGNAIEADARAVGLRELPMSANEYQPADRQTAGVTAWYADRFAQSKYTNAMRGNWQCCTVPNLTGLLTHTSSGWAPTGNWWALKTYADLTGTLVATSGQDDSTAIAAAKDRRKRRAVALIGDSDGYTGDVQLKLDGLRSTPWLLKRRHVHVTVMRIPDQGPLYAPSVVFDESMDARGGSVTVPVTFTDPHDAFGVYLSWDTPQTVSLSGPSALAPGHTYKVPVTFTNGSGVMDAAVRTKLTVSSADPDDAADVKVACGRRHVDSCLTGVLVPPGRSRTTTFTITVPSNLVPAGYRLTASTSGHALSPGGGRFTVGNSTDIVAPCAVGSTCEAEDGTMSGGACLANDHPGYSGSGFVACFTSPGPAVAQKFSVDSAGTYTLDVRYSAGPSGPASTRTATLTVNGVPQQMSFPRTSSWDDWGTASAQVRLTSGVNTISLSYGKTDTGWLNIDHFVLTE